MDQSMQQQGKKGEEGAKHDAKQSSGHHCVPARGRRLLVILVSVLVLLLLVAAVILVVLLVGKENEKEPQPANQKTTQSEQPSQPPNVVFVLADDLGYDDVSYHGSTQIKTPNLDALCADGIQLENYYVQPTCTPTRSQLLTGRYQIRNGMSHKNIRPCQPKTVPVDETLLPEKLRDAGYRTHMVGKWHLGHYKEEVLPHNRGFDSFYGMLLGAGHHFWHSNEFKEYDEEGKLFNKTHYLDLRENDQADPNQRGHYSTHLFTQKAIDVINNQTEDQPFFLYLAYQGVHGPLQVPDEYRDMYEYQNISNPSRRTLAAMVTALDEGVGNVTEALKAKGLWNNTVFIFSSDNGSHYPGVYNNGRNWPLRGGKNTLFEGGMRVAAFVTGGFVPVKGVVNHELLHVSDWFPTIVQGLAGGDTNGTKPLDGFDQWETISGDRPSPRKSILHNIDILTPKHGTTVYNDTFDTRVRAALRIGEMKLLTGSVGPYRGWIPPDDGREYDIPEYTDPWFKNLWLFNLTSDPYETTDLSEEMPDLVLSMLDILAEFNETAVEPFNPSDDPRCDPGLRDGLWGPWL